MDAALGLGLGDALDAVGAGFELEAGIDAAAADAHHHLLEAAEFALAGAHLLRPPATDLGVSQVHAQEVGGEEGGLGATGPGPHLQEDVTLIVGVRWDQQALQLGFQGGAPLPGRVHFFPGQPGHLRIGEHGLGVGEVLLDGLVAVEAAGHGLELGVFLAQGAEPGLVPLDLGFRHQGGDLGKALGETLQLALDGGIHQASRL